MATKEQIELILSYMDKHDPVEMYKKMLESNGGINAVMRFLYESQKPVTAGQISKEIRVSTARVAVLLKKMEAKGLIEKTVHEKDARVIIVKLSEHGIQTAETFRQDMYDKVNKVIDTIGMERMLEFSKTMDEVHQILKAPDIEL